MIYSIKNILVAIDYSDSSINALRIAIDTAVRQNAELHLVNIIQNNTIVTSGLEKKDYFLKLVELQDNSNELLAKYANNIQLKYGIKTHVQCEMGYLEEIVNDIIINQQIDLLVIGTHGTSGWKNLFAGSNAMALIKHAICPVLIVPQYSEKTSFSEILFPVRYVEGVVQKYDYVRPIVDKNDAYVHVLGIANDTNEEKMTSEMEKAIEVISSHTLNISSEKIITKSIAEKILDIAHSRNSDLLVINATLDQNWKNFFSGSYTQQIINHAKIPVLCIKPTITKAEIAAEYYYLVAEAAYPMPNFLQTI